VDAELAREVRTRLAGDALALDELGVILCFGAVTRAVVAAADRFPAPWGLARLPDVIERLAAIGEYAAFAREALETADARVAAIQAGQVPYQADKAFTTIEADVLWRACQVALARDEPWLGELLSRLLPGVVVAPTAAKTVPSQSAGHVLAQAVEAWPTPEAVAALRQARRVVRHAGMIKKLDRLLRQAEKGLARRPTIAMRLPGPGAPTRAQLTVLVRALEAGYAHQVSYCYDRWLAELAGHPHLRGLAARLIWDIQVRPGTWHSVLPLGKAGDDGLSLADGAGDPVAAPSPQATVRLWHPALAGDPERTTWRDRIVELRLDQPFRQAFREHYLVSDADDDTTGLFAGHVVAIRPLLGLAVREGWRSDHLDGVLRRQAGPWQVELEVTGPLFPGAQGYGPIGAARLRRREAEGWRPARFADAPPVIVSEALRWVDLLVSVAGFALEDDPGWLRDAHRHEFLTRLARQPLSESARMRRTALQAVFSGAFPADLVRFGERHVHVGPYAVHLATARVTRDGEPVAVDVPPKPAAAALPWLPYDERLLERIVHVVVTLAAAERVI
jgi:hypothetical protein